MTQIGIYILNIQHLTPKILVEKETSYLEKEMKKSLFVLDI